MRQRAMVFLTVISLLLTVAGCGSPEPGPEVFTPDNAWTGPIPDDAEVVSPDEFRKRVGAGELVITSTQAEADAAAARQAAYETDHAQLLALSDPSASLQALLHEADGHADFQGDVPVTRPDGDEVVLEGLGTRLRNAVAIRDAAQSVANALTDYRQTYDLLPDDVKAGVPTPASLDGKPLADVQQALQQVNAALAGSPALRNARLEAKAIAPGAAVAPQAVLQPGAGSDHDAACAEPTGLAAQYWFPLKSFLSPVKNQGKRGTCWAFTAIGAVESRERVQNENPVDLSEQFLVNKVKEDWDSDDYSDGYWPDRALNAAVSEGQALPDESGWTYNPAWKRPSVTDGDDDSYDDACDPYGTGPNAGSCSETSHESPRVCSTYLVVTVCSYATVNFGGPGVASSSAYQVWANGQPFELDRYRLLLAQGHVLLASFPVYKGFMDDAVGGVVSNYAQTRLDDKGNEVSGSYGGHAVQIVGFLSNADMSKPGRTPVNIGGGGYFIIKNSWGCGAGDGGYYYVPADYVSSLFNSLSTLAFDARRSAAWTAEQATPGGRDAPAIQIKKNPATVDLRVETDIATFFLVSHPVAKSVRLKISSNALGTLYDGPWSTDKDALFGPVLDYTFPSSGDQYLALNASYGSSSSQAVLRVRVVNSAPTLQFEGAGDPHQGEPYTLNAIVADVNEAGTTGLCANTSWSVDAPDTLSATSGCQVQVTFAATGDRAVRATTRDTEGLTASRTLTLNVGEPLPNPYPRISGGGVYASDPLFFHNTFIGCTNNAVSQGATIDLREDGCTLSVIGDPPKHYSAAVTVENPDAEALTYDWRLYITDSEGERVYTAVNGSSEPSYELHRVGNFAEATVPCRATVLVHAPDPSRDKSQTLWSGQCVVYLGQLN